MILSTFADNFIAFQALKEYDYLFYCSKKSEIVTVLSEEAAAFNINVNFSDSMDIFLEKKKKV